MSAVTIAKMIQLQESKTISLPADFFEKIRPKEESSAVMILAPSTKIIRIIPSKSPEVVKLTIEISELTPDFLQELGVVFMRGKIRTLYSTGLCFTQDSCTYEAYLDSSDLTISQEQLRDELTEIKGVSKAEFTTITA